MRDVSGGSALRLLSQLPALRSSLARPSGGSALRLLSRLPALRSTLARPAHAMLSVWASPHGTPSQTVCNPGNETQAHLSIKIA